MAAITVCEKAVFAGSFDPFTLGHLDIVRRAAPLFQELIVLVGMNRHKQGFLTLEERIEVASLSTSDIPQVRVDRWDGLTVDYMRRESCRFLVRGLRGARDLEWEQSVAWANSRLAPECETVYLISATEYLYLSSSTVREMLSFGADISTYIAPAALSLVQSKCSP